MNRKNIAICICILIIFTVFSISVIKTNDNLKTITTTSETISNKKIGWGIKRNQNNEQPDVGSNNRKVLEENNGICLGDKEKKYIYLTFDEGYEAGYTAQILDVLKQNDVKATFFITAHYVNTASDLVRRMINEGHIVGNHTVNHKSMPEITNEQIEEEVMKLHQVIYEKFGYEMKYIRPPMGEFSERTLIKCNSLGYKTVMWSFAYCDWNENSQPDKEVAKQMILNNLHNGEIMLLHGNSKTNTDILDEVIKEIKNKGYELRSLDKFE